MTLNLILTQPQKEQNEQKEENDQYEEKEENDQNDHKEENEEIWILIKNNIF